MAREMTDHSSAKRIALLVNPDKPRALQVADELRQWLSGRVEIVADNCGGKQLDLAKLQSADFAIVLGGDGTILSTVRKLHDRQVPLIGVNMGKLGFLAEFSVAQLKDCFDQVISDDSLISRRIILDCLISGPDRQDYHTRVVNEVAVIAGPPFRMIEVSVSVGDEHLALCAGDGLVVATSTGSTAYNLSAGGPILASDLSAVVITPLAAHSLSFRPIVLTLNKPIVLRCRRPNARDEDSDGPGRGTAVVSVDGQDNIPLNSSEQVNITPARECFQLVRNPQQGQWRLLNVKLNWGVLPNYDYGDVEEGT